MDVRGIRRVGAAVRRRVPAVFLCLVLLWMSACRPASPISRSQTRYLFDTVVTITVYDPYTDGYYSAAGRERPDLDQILTGAMELCQHYEDLLSRTKEGSDIWRINHADGAPVEVDTETAALLERCQYFSEMSGGAFDVTVAPVSELWDFHPDSPRLPTEQALAEAAGRVDYRKLQLDENTVTLPAGMAVDLGGAAKGFIADRIAAYLLEQGIDSALLDFGGNVVAVGGKASRQLDGPEDQRAPFHIGVRDPDGDASGLAAVVYIQTGSVVTSGTYERYFEQDGRRYHHILNPDTGWPVENGLASVTIFSDRSTDGDILSTACFVLGPEEGLALAESLAGVEALFIDDEGKAFCTSGLSAEGEAGKIQLDLAKELG